MPSNSKAELQGLRVLVTRPREQAQALTQGIIAAGGQVVLFPTLEIRATAKQAALQHAITQLPRFSMAIFISPNAVDYALPMILAQHGTLPPGLQLACVGRGSAAALTRHGWHSDITPGDQANSEALLALPAMQTVRGKKIAIFRGNGGREQLRNTLRARGAEVDYVECYERVAPHCDTAELEQALTQGQLDIITQTSGEGLTHLFTLLSPDARRALLQLPLLVISPRIAALARDLGYRDQQIIITANSSATKSNDDAMIEALGAWHSQRKTL